MGYLETAESLRRMAVQHQAIIDAADAFEALGSIEGATKEATSKREQAEKDLLQAKANLQIALDAREAAQREAEQLIAAASKRSEDIHNGAIMSADGTLARANQQASDIVEEARKGAEAIIAKTHSDMADMVASLDALKVEVTHTTQQRDLLIADADKAQARLDAVHDAINKLQGAM